MIPSKGRAGDCPPRATSNDLWDALREHEHEFSEAVKEGHVLAEAWWSAQGKRGLFGSSLCLMRPRQAFRGLGGQGSLLVLKFRLTVESLRTVAF